MNTTRLTILLLSCVLALLTQTAAVASQSDGSELKIFIVEGEGGTNNIRKGTAMTRPVVEVRDRNDKPVAGALVTFTLPQTGASGVFAGGGNTATVSTDALGRASAAFKPTGIGQLKLQVTAAHQGQTASTSIAQTNAATATAGMSGTTLGIIGAVAAGAAVAAVCASGKCGGGKEPAPAPAPPQGLRIGAGSSGVYVGPPPR